MGRDEVFKSDLLAPGVYVINTAAGPGPQVSDSRLRACVSALSQHHNENQSCQRGGCVRQQPRGTYRQGGTRPTKRRYCQPEQPPGPAHPTPTVYCKDDQRDGVDDGTNCHCDGQPEWSKEAAVRPADQRAKDPEEALHRRERESSEQQQLSARQDSTHATNCRQSTGSFRVLTGWVLIGIRDL